MTRRHSQIGKRRRGTRTIVLTAATAIALCVAGQSATALAQQVTAPLLDARDPQPSVWPAPVGHRQPTRSDLPPGLRQDEGAITPRQRAFDGSLDICRNC